MAINVGQGGGDRQLPPQYPSPRFAPSPYQGFQHPPLFDPGRGHNLPLVPEENAFLGLFTVEEDGEFDDYVLCEGIDPATGNRAIKIPVAKPHMLQKKPFDGETIQWSSYQVSYTYDENVRGKRTAEAEVDSVTVREIQYITPEYFAGDLISVAKVNFQDLEVDGITASLTDDGQPIEWIDLNMSGRVWAFRQAF